MDRIQALSAPKPGTLIDLTERVRLLGDSPMHSGGLPSLFSSSQGLISNDVSGAFSEFWLGGTSSGNVVMVKLVRRHVGVGDANVSKHVSQEFFFPKAI